jgi:plastocyanin
MKSSLIIPTFVLLGLTGCMTSKPEMMGNMGKKLDMASFFLPNAEASRVVSVTTNGPVAANILVQTHAVAVKETGPKETVSKFGEVYAFSPTFFAVHRDEPTMIRFWNLQPDDNHDFMLIDPHSHVLMSVLLPPLKETAYVFTFHEEGLFNLICAMHQPSMNAQVLVLPPRSANP